MQQLMPPVQTKSLFNYGGFGMDKKRTASLPANSLVPLSQRSSFLGASREALDFKPVEQFRMSLAEVGKGKFSSRIFN